MIVFIDNNCAANEIERMTRLFFPDEKINVIIGKGASEESFSADVRLKEIDSVPTAVAAVFYDGGKEEFSQQVDEKILSDKPSLELFLAEGLYFLLCKITGYNPPWGMLTGVRPVKLLRMLLDEDGEEYAREILVDRYHCSQDKYDLCRQTMQAEHRILELSKPESFSLYISIPFCPTRCSYCSFVSQSVEKAKKLMPDYVSLLVKEIEATAQLAKEIGLCLETVYMGGGTPTTLNAEQLYTVLGAVNKYFDMSAVREFTVEAGRPDTVTIEKLQAIKACGAERISINPQTLSDEVLANIGRKHSAAQVYEAMNMARSVGFESINMDLIAGLPGDDIVSFGKTLDGVLSMKPENITVHTLSMKRASTLVTSGQIQPDAFRNPASDMLEVCAQRLPENAYRPYYLYRQTRMLGNLENVGWALDGHDGLYNVYIMDETHTILAVGAGGVTKMRQPGVNNIDRVYNYKFPYEYISQFETILERKKEVKRFYEEFC